MFQLDPLLLERIQTQDVTDCPPVDLSLAQQALEVLKGPIVWDEKGLFRLLCAGNLLNVVVKQSEDPIWQDHYGFKGLLIDRLAEYRKAQVLHGRIEDEILMIECVGLIFSFHHLDLKDHPLKLKPMSQPWQGFRLQPYAIDLFLESQK